jgi:hypothetical protein
MLRFIIKISFLVLLVTITAVPVFFIYSNPNAYYAANIDKINLLKKTGSPKIVFIGGSNLAFGLNSELIKNQLNINVVNMGLHAGLGLRFMIDEIKPHLKKGDIVVMVPEYQQFSGNFADGDDTLVQLLYVNPCAVWSLSSVRQIYNVATKYNYFHKILYTTVRKTKITPHFFYHRFGFNGYGDMTGHLNEKRIGFNPVNIDYPPDEISEETVKLMGEFHDFSQKRGVMLLMSYPNITEMEFKNAKEKIEIFSRKLEKKINIRIINTQESQVYPDELFFDTPYHLHEIGRDLRSKRLINDIKKSL